MKRNWHKYSAVLRTFRLSPLSYVYFCEIYLICLNEIYLTKYFATVRKSTHQTPSPPWAVPRRLQPECGPWACELLNKSTFPFTPLLWQGAVPCCSVARHRHEIKHTGNLISCRKGRKISRNNKLPGGRNVPSEIPIEIYFWLLLLVAADYKKPTARTPFSKHTRNGKTPPNFLPKRTRNQSQ